MKRSARRKLCLALAALVFLLSACSSKQPVQGSGADTVSTLAPASNPYDAPIDDNGLSYETLVNLYLPSRDGQRLQPRQVSMTLVRGSSNARAIVQALLDYRPDASDPEDWTRAVGGQTALRLSGSNPVEVSGDVCTVNLVGTANALEYDEMYTLCLALAATLSEASGIRYVNLLVENMPVSFDVGGYLPAGSVEAQPGEELAVLWYLMESRKTPLGSSAASQRLTATATLYFPLADGSGFIAQARELTFMGQTPDIMASRLLAALSAWSQSTDGCAALPDIQSLLELSPEVSEHPGGGRVITLRFRSDLEEMLGDVSLANFVACVNWTLSTFIPSVRAVRFYIGSSLLTAVSDDPYGLISVPDGMTQRSHFSAGLRELDRIYMARNNRLTLVSRSVSADQAGHPRALLNLMLDGVTAAEAALGITSPFPDSLGSGDVLGISIQGDCLLINLSTHFASQLISMSESEQRLCCYAMTDSLCDSLQLTRVRFYWGSEVHGQLGSPFDWSGEFMLNHTLTGI